MNSIRSIQALNKRELEAGIYNPNASWHVDYRDTAFVSFGGIPFTLTEGDIITIFSQYGEPVFLKLARDKETGKSKGFGWLKYEDQRSTDLAVDNLAGAEIAGRLMRVDHARYKIRDDEDADEGRCGWEDMMRRETGAQGGGDDDVDEAEDENDEPETPSRPLLKEEQELAKLVAEHDDDDPMKSFLIEEKKREVQDALHRVARKDRERKGQHRHRHHRSHRARRDDDATGKERDREKERSRDQGTRDPERYRERDRDRDRDRDQDRDRDGDRTRILQDHHGERERHRRRGHRNRSSSEERFVTRKRHDRTPASGVSRRDTSTNRRRRSRSPRAHRDR